MKCLEPEGQKWVFNLKHWSCSRSTTSDNSGCGSRKGEGFLPEFLPPGKGWAMCAAMEGPCTRGGWSVARWRSAGGGLGQAWFPHLSPHWHAQPRKLDAVSKPHSWGIVTQDCGMASAYPHVDLELPSSFLDPSCRSSASVVCPGCPNPRVSWSHAPSLWLLFLPIRKDGGPESWLAQGKMLLQVRTALVLRQSRQFSVLWPRKVLSPVPSEKHSGKAQPTCLVISDAGHVIMDKTQGLQWSRLAPKEPTACTGKGTSMRTCHARSRRAWAYCQ